jgi:uncharacterized membrane protein YhaH (DUF805 family)
MSKEGEEGVEVSEQDTPINTDGAPAEESGSEPYAAHRPPISFEQSVILGFKNYSNFRGRATRREWFNWCLFVGFMEGIGEYATTSGPLKGLVSPAAVNTVITIILATPTAAVYARRAHDTNKPWHWIDKRKLGLGAALCVLTFVMFLVFPGLGDLVEQSPRIGMILFIAYFLFSFGLVMGEGDPGENKYGPPRGETL